jgi:hypothetical protein
VARVTVEGFELPLSHVLGVVSGFRHPVIIGTDVMSPVDSIWMLRLVRCSLEGSHQSWR